MNTECKTVSVPPYVLKDGTLYDGNQNELKLWGVNYYAPFNHNYYNIQELGKNHYKAIDRDLKHFEMLGINFIRMHLYDREISDRDGNIVENHQMEVFDYLIDQCEKHGIFLQITLLTWWNSVVNELNMKQGYACWHLDEEDAFGFSNFYSKDAMVWDENAIRCQKTYCDGLCSRKSTVSGKTLSEYTNIVSIELFNETTYPEWDAVKYWIIDRTPNVTSNLCRGADRKRFLARWNQFKKDHPEFETDEECFRLFRRELIDHHFAELFPLIKSHFQNNIILAAFSGGIDADLWQLMAKHGVTAYTYNGYLTEQGFDSYNVDFVNFLPLAKKLWDKNAELIKTYPDAEQICYEHGAVSTQNGYPLSALAVVFAKLKTRLAAYFTYTPESVAAWNPGWLTHYLNLEHTPSRAANFAVAGELFRNLAVNDTIELSDEKWEGTNFLIQQKDDLSWIKTDTAFRYSASNDVPIENANTLTVISGRGNSELIESDGNGFYMLVKESEKKWTLTVCANQEFIRDPQRGKSYKFMSNRFVSCLSEPPVSLLKDEPITFLIKFATVRSVQAKDSCQQIHIAGDQHFSVPAGEYVLTLE